MEPFWSHMLPKPYFENDGVTLYFGDCREILPELQSETFDLVVTDPPYLVSHSGRWGSDWGVIEGDSDQSWVLPVFCDHHFRVAAIGRNAGHDRVLAISRLAAATGHAGAVFPS